MAKKDKRGRYDADYKAKIVARALQAKESGSETIGAIAESEGLYETTIYNWLAAVRKSNGAVATSAKGDKVTSKGKGGDIKTLSRELVEAMERVSSIKKRMRKLLGEE